MAYVHMPDAVDLEGMLGGSGTHPVWIRPIGGGPGHFLGELALVRSFVRWASRHHVYDVLDHLLEPEERVSGGLTVRLARSVDRLRSLPADAREPAVALVVPDHAGAVRWLVAAEPAPALASAWGELRLQDGTLTAVPAAGPPVPVRGWSLTEGGAEVDADGGSRVPADAGLTELLRAAGRGAAQVSVRQVPARSAFTPLLVALSDGLQDVVHEHGDMVISRIPG